ncbi:hypothetical protein FSP39_021794 [Pinctada imbricata]|uniref:Uncharacterized protein n=1 Tax=Pinctada imbricata TaxID=66713 RepID=A0AA88YGZ6_PINIB|nr:hypothetical protein FSP39_021794 [Pinctada imbricata]
MRIYFIFQEEDSPSVAVARALFSTSTPLESDSASTFPPPLSPLPEPTTPTVSDTPALEPLSAATPDAGRSTTTGSTSFTLPSTTPTSRPPTSIPRPSTSGSPLVLDRTDATLLSLVKSVLAKNNVMTKMLAESNQLMKRLDAKVSSQAIQIQQEQVQHLTTLNHPTAVPPSALVNPGQIAEESENNPYVIPTSTLLEMKRCSLNPGNFAVKIVERLFPELFGEDNLRL